MAKRAASSDKSAPPRAKKRRTSEPKVETRCTTCNDEERDCCGQCKTNNSGCSYTAHHPKTEPARPTPPPSSTKNFPIVDPPEVEGPLDFHDSDSLCNGDDTNAENCRGLQSTASSLCDDEGTTTEVRINVDYGYGQTTLDVFDTGKLPFLEDGSPLSDSPSEAVPSDSSLIHSPLSSMFVSEIPCHDDAGYCSDSDAESTLTVTDINFNFVEENARTYHAAVWNGLENWEPLDERQIKCHDLSHDVWTRANEGRLSLAPVCKGANVLDLGTGSGVWAIHFVDENESRNVLGIDICPMQPESVPSGVRFELDNFDSGGYTEPESRYHYIHGRGLGGSVTDWPRLLRTAFRGTKPGGWIELAQDDIHLHTDGELHPMLDWWVQKIIHAGEVSGKSFSICGRLKEWVEGAGFINVEEIRIPVPVGYAPDDPDRLGMLNLNRHLKGADGLSLRLMTGILGMDVNEVNISLAGVRQALKDAYDIHQDFVIVIGQRPWG